MPSSYWKPRLLVLELGVAIPVGEGTQIIPSSTRYRGCGSDKTGGGENKSKELNDAVVDV